MSATILVTPMPSLVETDIPRASIELIAVRKRSVHAFHQIPTSRFTLKQGGKVIEPMVGKPEPDA